MSTAVLQMIMKAKDSASGVIGRVAGSLSNMLQIAGGNLMASALGNLARWMVGVAKEAATSAARVVEMEAVLGVLAKNAGLSANAVMNYRDAVKAAGITTQTANTTIARFIQNNLDLSKAQAIATVAQDAAVISMTDSSEALDGIIHGITTMNTRVLRTYGINIGNVSDAWDKYSETLGKTTEDLTINEKQHAVLLAVMEVGTRIAGSYEAAMGTAGKQLRSMKRHVTELFNALGMPLQNAFSMAIMAGTNFLKFLRELAEEGAPLNRILTSIGELLSIVFSTGADNAGKALEGLTGVLDKVATSMEKFVGRVGLAKFLFKQGDPVTALSILGIPKDFTRKMFALIEDIKQFVADIKTGIADVKAAFESGGLEDALEAMGLSGDVQEKILGMALAMGALATSIASIDVAPLLEIGEFAAIAIGAARGVFMISKALGFLAGLSGVVATVVFWFGEIAAFVSLLVGALTGGGGLMGVLTAIAGVFTATFSPVILLAVAIGILVATIVKFGGRAKEIFLGLKDQVVTIFGLIRDRIVKAWDDAKTKSIDRMNTLKVKVKAALVALKSIVIKRVSAIRDQIVKKFDQIKDKVSDAWDNIKDLTSEKLEAIRTTIVEKVEGFLEAIGFTEEIRERWRVIWEDVKEILLAVAGWLLIKMIEIGLFILEKWNEVREFVSQAWAGILATIMEWVTAIWDWLIEAWGAITEFFAGIWETISTAVAEAWETIVNTIREALAKTLIAIQEKLSVITDWLRGKWDSIKTTVIAKWNVIKAKIGEIWGNIKKVIEEKLQPIIDVIREGWDRVVETLKGFKDRLFQIGKDLIDGIKEGVLSAIGGLIESVTAGVEQALQAAKDVLGIESPSKEGRGIAENFMQTTADWVKKKTPELQKAFAQVGEAMAGSLGGQMAGVGAGAGGGFGGGATAQGSTVIVHLTFSPAVSLADEEEVNEKIIPFIERGIRKAQEDGRIT